jgi:hypothetical protein
MGKATINTCGLCGTPLDGYLGSRYQRVAEKNGAVMPAVLALKDAMVKCREAAPAPTSGSLRLPRG